MYDTCRLQCATGSDIIIIIIIITTTTIIIIIVTCIEGIYNYIRGKNYACMGCNITSTLWSPHMIQ